MNFMSETEFQEEEIFIVSPQTVEGDSPSALASDVVKEKSEAAWTDAKIKLLLDSISEMRPKVGKSPKLVNKSKMWQAITRRFLDHGYIFTTKQIMNKFSGLERQYKKAMDNKRAGRKTISCPFQSELEKLLGNIPSLEPDYHSITEEYVDCSIGIGIVVDETIASPHKKKRSDVGYQLEMLRKQKAEDALLFRQRLETNARLSREQQESYQKEKLQIMQQHFERKEALLRAILDKSK